MYLGFFRRKIRGFPKILNGNGAVARSLQNERCKASKQLMGVPRQQQQQQRAGIITEQQWRNHICLERTTGGLLCLPTNESRQL